MKSLALKTSALLEIFFIQALLYLVLLPLKLIYRAPQPSWNSWFMNQKLCQLDRQYCWNSPHGQVAIPITQKNLLIWLPQPYKLALTITHLSSLNTSLLKRSPFRFKTSPTGSNGKAGQCHWLSGSCTSLLRTWPIRCPLAAKDTTKCRNDWGSCGSFDWLQPRTDQSRAITSQSFAAQPIFCSNDHSDPQRKVRHWIDESNFSLPGLRPIHREIVSNLQKTHGANFLLNLQWSKAAWCCYRFKKDVVLDQPWLIPITGDAYPTSRRTHPSQRIQFLTQRIKSQTRRPPTPTPLKNWAQVKP